MISAVFNGKVFSLKIISKAMHAAGRFYVKISKLLDIGFPAKTMIFFSYSIQRAHYHFHKEGKRTLMVPHRWNRMVGLCRAEADRREGSSDPT